LKTKLAKKETVLDSNNELQKQMQATIDGLTLTGEVNSRTIDDLRITDKSKDRTIQELRDKQEHLLDTIDNLTKTVEAKMQAVQLTCGQQKDVSTHKVEAITITKWDEKPPAINIASFRPNNVGL
jgi:ABC-type transporter Mla subunit MlaD